MDELVPLYNSYGQPEGCCSLKSEAHKYGWWHGTIHLWLCDPDGRLWFQRRSPHKQVFPDLWDVSTAGHINGWESPLQAVIRETWEELGIQLLPGLLRGAGVFASEEFHPENGILDREFHHAFVYTQPVSFANFRLDPIEVSEVHAYDRDILLRLPKHRQDTEGLTGFVPHEPGYARQVLELLRECFG